MHRIYMPETVLNKLPLEITGELHHQIGRVLRSRPGNHLTVICGDGYEYEIRIRKIEKSKTDAEVIDKRSVDNEPSAEIILYQGNLKGKSMDEIIPSLVYLGVSKLIPVRTVRSEGFFDPSSPSGRKRVDGIVQKATALCHRTKLMDVSCRMEFKEALDACGTNLLNLIFCESIAPVPLKRTLAEYISQNAISSPDLVLWKKEGKSSGRRRSVGIFIGPEGGFDESEIEKAQLAGAMQVSLGKRILDAKTAPIAAVSALLYELGDL